MTEPNITAFAEEARRFRSWALNVEGGAAGVHEALRRLVALYHAALSLPMGGSDDGDDTVEFDGREERDRVVAACACLPFQYYSEIFDPLPVPAGHAVTGDIADDIGDIFADASEGLWLFDRGRALDAAATWGFQRVPKAQSPERAQSTRCSARWTPRLVSQATTHREERWT